MRVIFTKELKMVADDLDRLSKGVHLAIDQAGKALLDSDIDTAQAVIDGDAALDKLENDILNHCVTLLAQQSPVATDLRVVVSTLRLAATFDAWATWPGISRKRPAAPTPNAPSTIPPARSSSRCSNSSPTLRPS